MYTCILSPGFLSGFSLRWGGGGGKCGDCEIEKGQIFLGGGGGGVCVIDGML